MDSLLELRFDVTNDDWVAYLRHRAITPAIIEGGRRRALRQGLVAGVVTTVGFGAFGYLTAPSPAAGMVRAAVFAGVMGALAAGFVLMATSREKMRQLMSTRLDNAVRRGELGPFSEGECHVVLQEDCAATTLGGQLITYPWEAALPIVEDSGALYLEFRAKGMIRIPDRAFATPAERAQFKSVVEGLRERAGAPASRS